MPLLRKHLYSNNKLNYIKLTELSVVSISVPLDKANPAHDAWRVGLAQTSNKL